MELTPASLRALMAPTDRDRIARACGVDRTTASRWASGSRVPLLRHVPNILLALGVESKLDTRPDASNTDITRFAAAKAEVRRHAGA